MPTSPRILPFVTAFAVAACASGGGSMPTPVAAPAQVDTVRVVDTLRATPDVPDTALQAGRFDNGKMWTFEYPPLDYFREAYGFAPDSAWFVKARLGALRLPNCSASFVSANGLVLTNHHCARESATKVTREGEDLLHDGFYAAAMPDERPVDELYADQLVAIEDVTASMDSVADEDRDAREEAIRERLATRYGARFDSVVVEVIALWNGAKTSAYVFHRFTDLRLVLVPELQMGFFGGDPDNFTYPRYALDMSFFRVYENGQPYHPEQFFTWSPSGVAGGDAVFIVGNPGSTNRLQTVAQLEFRRDVSDKATLEFIRSRADAMQAFADAHPAEAERIDLQNTIFSLRNSQKAYQGMLDGLHDPVILARRRDAEQRMVSAIQADSALRRRYGDAVSDMAEVERRKRRWAAELSGFVGLGNESFAPETMLRAIYGFQYLAAKAGSAPADRVDQLATAFREVGSQPDELETALLAARFRDLAQAFGDDNAMVRQLLKGRTAPEAASAVVEQSALSDSARAVQALEDGTLTAQDPGIQALQVMLQRFGPFQQGFSQLQQREQELALTLGRVRFALFGTKEPPDATFSLRIADGVVRGYEYNGTIAPAHTTFYGLYDRYHSFGADSDWDLPRRWADPPAGLDLAAPLDFVSTADIIGGNSGSPVLDRELQLVGVVFDGNIESLPGDYIYLPEKNRAVAVDARGMLEALRHVYGAARLVRELTGRP